MSEMLIDICISEHPKIQTNEEEFFDFKEIDKSLLTALKLKIEILGAEDDSVETYKERLEKLRKSLELEE